MKKKKREKLSRKVEVDVSGAVAQTSASSVFAFSNGDSFTILITSKIKKLALEYFRLMVETKFHETFYFSLYIAGLIILLKHLVIKNIDVLLDTELYGQDEKIRRELKTFFLNSRNNFYFKQIGRKSPAHLLAKDVFLRKVTPGKIVTFVELKKYLISNKKRSATPKVKATY